ncbi:hypothetical protein CAEBREN_25079 [Caenorhabditis brenneri]|uniref:BTB domain-containing protein n=1 Tax=Caenorhabditis brenneri TaxID=135651 RepID=G0MUX4_CAEBE|nr:hypothetical protein CAEBREN_25079 [Caenorhabditis brenneri]
MNDNAVPEAGHTIRFDDPDPNIHDVVINVKGQKFYCVKMTLAKHSPHFYNLFFKDPKHTGRKQITLQETVEPDEFNTLLMILHGVNKLNDEVVSGVLWMSKLWDCGVGLQQCVDFLEKSSNLSNKEKFDIAVDYELKDFKKKIIAECSSCDALHRIMPRDLMQLDHVTMGLIFERNLALQGFPGRYEPRVRERAVTPPRRPLPFFPRPPVFRVENREARPESSSSSSSSSSDFSPSSDED